METTELEIITDYKDIWPLLCLFCGHDKLIYSQHKDDVKCQCCGHWQLDEESNDD